MKSKYRRFGRQNSKGPREGSQPSAALMVGVCPSAGV